MVGQERSALITRFVFWAVAIAAALLVLAPLVSLFFGAMRTASPGDAESLFTLRNLSDAYLGSEFRKPLFNSLYVAIFVTIFATAIGTCLAWLVGRTDIPFKSALEILVIMPLFLSQFTTALAWSALAAPNSGFVNLLASRWFGLTEPLVNIHTVTGIIFVLSLALCPYAYLLTIGALRSMDPSLEEASAMLGGGLLPTMRRITLPIVLPAFASSALLIFVMSLETFTVPAVLGTDVRFFNLLWVIYNAITHYPPNYPGAAAAGTLLLWFTVLGMYLYQRMIRQQSKFVTVTARGFRPRLVRLGRWKGVALGVVGLYALMAVVLPYAILLLASFLPILTTNIDLSRLTLRNYSFIFTHVPTRSAITNSLMLATAVASICAVAAGLISYIIYRTQMVGRTVLEYITSLPLAIPGIVLGVGMLWTYIRIPLPIYGSLTMLLVAYVTRYLSYGLRSTSAGLLQIDRTLEEAATIAGASRLKVIRDVTARLLRPTALSAWMLIFITCIKEIDMALMLYSPKAAVMSVQMWNFADDTHFTRSYALGIVQSVLILGVVFIARKVFKVTLSGV